MSYSSLSTNTPPVFITNPRQLNSIISDYKYTFNCKQCNKLVMRRFDKQRLNIEKLLLCQQCLLKYYNNKKYGVDYYVTTNSFKNKSKQTKMKLYGDEYYNNSKQISKTRLNFSKDKINEIQIKKRNTCYKKYNGVAPACSEEVKNKIKDTKFNRYGDSSYNNMTKNIQTNMAKRKVQYYFQSQEYKDHMKKIGYNYNRAISRYNYYGITFDSSWELAVWIYCINNNIKIIRNPIMLKYMDSNNKVKHYYPDFWIEGIGLVEIKGDQFINTDGIMYYPFNKMHHDSEPFTVEEKKYYDDLYKRKHQCALQNGIKIWMEKDIMLFFNYCKSFGGKYWYKLFKIDNPFNPSYANPNGYFPVIIEHKLLTQMYYTSLLFNNQVTPQNKIDNDGYIMNDNSRGITPFDIGK